MNDTLALTQTAPTPFIARRDLRPRYYWDDAGNQFDFLPNWGVFARLRIRDLQFKRHDGTWTDPNVNLRWLYDTGAWISVMPSDVLKTLAIQTWPIRDVGMKVSLSGAFSAKAGSELPDSQGVHDELCPVVYVLFGFPSVPHLMFPSVCAISERAKSTLIAENWISRNFHTMDVQYNDTKGTVGGLSLTLRNPNCGISRDAQFVPPVFPAFCF